MLISGRDILDSFAGAHADARPWIEIWIADTAMAKWRTPLDVKVSYSSASFLPGNVVILNVKGNKYRMELQLAYNTGVVIVRWVGTHASYTKRMKGT